MTLHHGDCREVMAGMDAESVDAIVTDPPYMLTSGKKGGAGSASIDLDSPYGRARVTVGNGSGGFMGKKWDAPEEDTPLGCQRWHESWAREAYRVLKPGGHLLAFGGTRTFHRLTCAIEDAGFEIRDCLSWLYGSGFPKSLDVGKAMDKARDDYPAIRAVVEFIRSAASASGHSYDSINAALGARAVADHFLKPSRGNAACPTWDQWLALKDLLSFGDEMDAEVWRLNGRKGQPGEAWCEREVVGKSPNGFGPNSGASLTHNLAAHPDITAPATDLARQWDGWGTALKPAWEPIVLARKPLAGGGRDRVELTPELLATWEARRCDRA